MKHRDTDYLHASTRVVYLDNRLVTRDDLMKAMDAGDAQATFRALSAKDMFSGYTLENYEKAFEDSLSEVYELVEDITGELGLTYIYRLPIDGHNLKVLVKSRLLSEDYSSLLKTGGTVDTEILQAEFIDRNFSKVPEALGTAALKASDDLAMTRDPQMVDLTIDKAVIGLMKEKTEQIDSEILTEYMNLKIDMTNLKTALRHMVMKLSAYQAAKAFIPGGSFSEGEFKESYAAGFEGLKKLSEKMEDSAGIRAVMDEIRDGASIGLFEQETDKAFGRLFEKASVIPFGIEPVIAFLHRKDQEVRACRMVLASKCFEISNEQIAERLGYIYAD